MKKYRKRIGNAICLTFLLAILMSSGVFAAERGSVYDNAALMDDDEVTAVNAAIEHLEEVTGWEVYALTINDAQGWSSQKYCEDWFDEHVKGHDAVVYLIDLDNGEIYIATEGTAVDVFTDRRIQSVIDAGYSQAKNGEYGNSFTGMLEKTTDYCQKSLKPYEILIAAILALAAGGITFGSVVGKYRLKWGLYKYDFHANGNIAVSREEDQFVNQIVTHHHIQRNPPAGKGSGSSTHTGAGGRSFGGGGRKL